MNNKQLSERIGNIDDRLVQQAESIPNYKKQNRARRIRRFASCAAALVLMLCSGAVGAIVFAKETIIEVPVKQETVELEELGLTLILPDSWKDRYRVIEDTFVPYNSPMWEFCVKSIYDAHTPINESGELFITGSLFWVYQCADYPMSLKEFNDEETGYAGNSRYLFATENGTYAIMYATDVQFDENDPAQMEEYSSMAQAMKDIQLVMDGIME